MERNETFCPEAKKASVKAEPLLQYFASWCFILLPDASAGSLLQLARRLVSIQQDRLSLSNVAGLFKLRLKPADVLK